MILVDTSVWVDHLRKSDISLAQILERGQVLMHPFVLGELAMGSLRTRSSILRLLDALSPAMVAGPQECLGFIEQHNLHGRGIGYVDLHLLASTLLSEGALLWTRDTRLHAVANSLGCAYRKGATH